MVPRARNPVIIGAGRLPILDAGIPAFDKKRVRKLAETTAVT